MKHTSDEEMPNSNMKEKKNKTWEISSLQSNGKRSISVQVVKIGRCLILMNLSPNETAILEISTREVLCV